jgi:hypothetical protein
VSGAIPAGARVVVVTASRSPAVVLVGAMVVDVVVVSTGISVVGTNASSPESGAAAVTAM